MTPANRTIIGGLHVIQTLAGWYVAGQLPADRVAFPSFPYRMLDGPLPDRAAAERRARRLTLHALPDRKEPHA